MKVIETIYDLDYERLVLDPYNYTDDEWNFILKLFGVKEVDRIVVYEYRTEVFERRDSSCQE